LDAEDSGLIVIGFDKGEGLAILFAASVDEARGGIFTSRTPSCLSKDCSTTAIGVDDGAGLALAMGVVGSRLDWKALVISDMNAKTV